MRAHRGFTLVEMIVAMTITGILGAVVAVFISGPIKGYADSARRAELTDKADLALKRMALENRTAVPNSVRLFNTTTSCDATVATDCYLEFIPARDGGRYCSDADSACDALQFNGSDTSFSVIGPVPASNANGQIVVYNTGQPGLNAYAGDNRRTVTGTVAATTTISSGLSLPSPSHRFQVIDASAPVTFHCDAVGVDAAGTGTGAVLRYAAYGFNASQAIPSGTGALLVDGVSACRFTYSLVSASNALVTLRLTLTVQGESVTLVNQFHVDSLP